MSIRVPLLRWMNGGERHRRIRSNDRAGLTIAMVLYGDLTHDSRVQREAQSLAEMGNQVVLVCLPAAQHAGSRFRLPGKSRIVSIRPPFTGALPGARREQPKQPFVRGVRRAWWVLSYIMNVLVWGWMVHRSVRKDVDVWHIHDFTGILAVLPWIARSPFIYDVHELHLEQPGEWSRLPPLARALIRRIERWAIRRSAAVITVNAAIASELRDRYGAEQVRVVHNCAPRWVAVDQRQDRIRRAAGIPSSRPVALYHGLFAAQRGLPQIIAALAGPGLEHLHAVFLGYGEMRDELRLAAEDPSHAGRIHVLDAVPPSELLSWVASADVSVMPIQPETLNGYLSTPNKLFEAIAAGVPVVTSDFPAMASIVLAGTAGAIGAVCDPTDPRSVGSAILGILSLPKRERDALKARCRAAADRWNWETESLVLTAEYVRLARRLAASVSA